jgi:tRNA A58 N-methylase Trm61
VRLLSALLVLALFQPRLRQPDVRYAATPPEIVEAMLDFAEVTPKDVVFDLGCGDGRIPIAAALRGARGVGIEIDMFHLRDAFDNVKKAGVGDRVRFLNQDMFESDLREATVVTLFLLPQVNQRLIPKLQRELRRGARIVAYMYAMGDAWPPDETRDLGGGMIYRWTIK